MIGMLLLLNITVLVLMLTIARGDAARKLVGREPIVHPGGETTVAAILLLASVIGTAVSAGILMSGTA